MGKVIKSLPCQHTSLLLTIQILLYADRISSVTSCPHQHSLGFHFVVIFVTSYTGVLVGKEIKML